METAQMTIARLMEKPETKLLMELEKNSSLETYEHSLAVANLVAKMAYSMDTLTDEYREDLVTGALLHDIGKIFIPFNLMNLPRRTTDAEFYIIKTHTAISYQIVAPVFSETVQNICLFHHERQNGSGYPGFCGDVPPEALFVQVADIYNALIQQRAYKESYTPEEALAEMEEEVKENKINGEYFAILNAIVTNC